MFTGIIERTARVIGVATGPGFWRVTLANHWADVIDGESIAVNGVCLTVAERTPNELGFDVVPETLSKTNLGLLAEGDSVHVERALRVGDRISGHFVQGHVDGTAALIEQSTDPDGGYRMTLRAPPELADHLTPKGSVTLDGVSLTIASVMGNEFQAALIPTTLQITLLGQRVLGWPFNLETDVLTKSVVTWLRNHATPPRG